MQIIVKICIFALMDDINEIFNLTDKQPQPQAGSLLVAKPTVDDLCFKRSVIMMIDISSQAVTSQEGTDDLLMFQALADSLNNESMKASIQQVTFLTDQILQEQSQMDSLQVDPQLQKDLELCNSVLKDSKFSTLKLSEQLKLIKKQQELSNQFTTQVLEQQSMLSTSRSNIANNMRSLFRAYNELLTILTKIIKSQDEDIKMLITEIATIQSDSQTLVDQLNLCLVLERQQKELIDYMNKQNRNAYIYGNVVTTIPGLLVMAKGFADLAMSDADPVKVDATRSVVL